MTIEELEDIIKDLPKRASINIYGIMDKYTMYFSVGETVYALEKGSKQLIEICKPIQYC